jgi:hypothetical protein
MNVVVVGHGPSLKKQRLGKKIDEADFVVRLKNCSMLLAERPMYGRRTDAMCSSTEVLHYLPKVKAAEYWCYPKKGFYNQASLWWLEKRVVPLGSKVIVPLDVCNLWNGFFRELGGRHPNVSTGMAAVIIALDRLKPKKLWLAGFDNVLNPRIEGYRSTVPTQFNDGGMKDTGHDWATENRMLPYLAAKYESEISDLAGGYDISPRGVQEVRQTVS